MPPGKSSRKARGPMRPIVAIGKSAPLADGLRRHVEGVAQEASGAVEGDAAALEMCDVELEDVMHCLEDLEFDRNSGLRRAIGKLPGVIEQSLVGTHLKKKRRQSSQLAKQRRGEGMAGICGAEILPCAVLQIVVADQGIGNG